MAGTSTTPPGPAAGGSGLRGLLGDKRARIGVGVAAAVGLLVLVLRGRAAGGTAGGGSGPAGTEVPGSSVQGTYDSIGTDLANGLASISGANTEYLGELQRTIKAQSDQIGSLTSKVDALGKPATGGSSLVRKLPGGSSYSVKAPGPASSKRTWAQLVPLFWTVPAGTSQSVIDSYAAKLRQANSWRPAKPGSGSGKWSTVKGGDLITVPA